MTANQHHWKAKNKKTGEVCTHNHHSKEHALRCAIAIYGEDCAGVKKWVDTVPTANRIERNNKKRARKVHEQMYSNALDKENNRRANKVRHNTNIHRKKSVRGLVKFDEKD